VRVYLYVCGLSLSLTRTKLLKSSNADLPLFLPKDAKKDVFDREKNFWRSFLFFLFLFETTIRHTEDQRPALPVDDG
jgi:hypothetical protein